MRTRYFHLATRGTPWTTARPLACAIPLRGRLRPLFHDTKALNSFHSPPGASVPLFLISPRHLTQTHSHQRNATKTVLDPTQRPGF